MILPEYAAAILRYLSVSRTTRDLTQHELKVRFAECAASRVTNQTHDLIMNRLVEGARVACSQAALISASAILWPRPSTRSSTVAVISVRRFSCGSMLGGLA